MAKIISSREIDNSATFFTLNIPEKGEKVLFLSSEFTNGLTVAYQSEEGAQAYANGFKCLLSGVDGLRPFVFPWQSLIANGTETIEGSTMPQMLHALTSRIARGGFKILEDLANSKSVGIVETTYALTVKKRKKNETYQWTTVGIAATETTYKATKEKITFEGHEITKAAVLEYFKGYEERQNQRLANIKAAPAQPEQA